MGKGEVELVNYSVNPHSSADQLQCRVVWIVEHEMVLIEVRELFSADAACDCGHVVNVRFLNHSAHGLVDGALAKLVQGVFFPDGLEVKVRATEQGFEKGQRASVRYGCRGRMKRGMRGEHE